MKKFYQIILYSLFLSILLEIFFSYLQSTTSLSYNIKKLLEEDPYLIWKQKSNLKTTFLKTNVQTDKYGFRIDKNTQQRKNTGQKNIVCWDILYIWVGDRE
jgi:hypothetical protein